MALALSNPDVLFPRQRRLRVRRVRVPERLDGRVLQLLGPHGALRLRGRRALQRPRGLRVRQVCLQEPGGLGTHL